MNRSSWIAGMGITIALATFSLGAGGRGRGPWWAREQAPASRATTQPAAAPANQPDATTAEPSDGPGRRGMGSGGAMREAMAVFHDLLQNHKAIERRAEDIPGGVLTVTTSKDPRIAAQIRKHVWQMKQRLEAGLPIRMWDPLFVEIVRNADKIDMFVEDTEGGVKVTETSKDDQIVLLIRQHAHRGVSEFVTRGFDRAHEEKSPARRIQKGGTVTRRQCGVPRSVSPSSPRRRP